MQNVTSGNSRMWGLASYLPLALGLVAFVSGARMFLAPSFSDAQIQASLVDTWEASSVGSLFLIGLETIGLAISGGLAWIAAKVTPRASRRYLVASALFLGGIVLTLLAQHILTTRAERLTGHSLGWW